MVAQLSSLDDQQMQNQSIQSWRRTCELGVALAIGRQCRRHHGDAGNGISKVMLWEGSLWVASSSNVCCCQDDTACKYQQRYQSQEKAAFQEVFENFRLPDNQECICSHIACFT